jgi:hypothetical protein
MATDLPRCFCYRTASEFLVDGALTKDIWGSIPAISLSMYSGKPPTYKTEVRALWNRRHICFGFQCEDPEPNCTMTKRDSPIFEDSNLVEVLFDPRGSGQDYFEFEVNALGTIMDLYFERLNLDWHDAVRWDAPGARAKTCIQRNAQTGLPTGWTAELCIPFADLGLARQPRSGDVWRANFFRYNTVSTLPGDHLELYAWSPTIIPKFDQPDRFGFLTFVDELSSRKS